MKSRGFYIAVILMLIVMACIITVNGTNGIKTKETQIKGLQQENVKLRSRAMMIKEPTTYIAADSTEYKYLDGYELRDGRAILYLKDGQVLNYPEDNCKFIPGLIPAEQLPDYGCFIYVEE